MAEPYGASGRSGEPGDICRIFAEGLLVQLIKEDGCGGGQPPRGARRVCCGRSVRGGCRVWVISVSEEGEDDPRGNLIRSSEKGDLRKGRVKRGGEGG